LRRWHKRQEAGTLADFLSLGPALRLQGAEEEQLLALVQEHPDATLDEHLRLWQEAERPRVSRATLGRAILRLGWTRKKRA